METFPGKINVAEKNLPPISVGTTFKGKNLLPGGANSFLEEQAPFCKGFVIQGGNQKIRKVV